MKAKWLFRGMGNPGKKVAWKKNACVESYSFLISAGFQVGFSAGNPSCAGWPHAPYWFWWGALAVTFDRGKIFGFRFFGCMTNALWKIFGKNIFSQRFSKNWNLQKTDHIPYTLKREQIKDWKFRNRVPKQLGPMSTSAGYLTMWAMLYDVNLIGATLSSRKIWPSSESVTLGQVSTCKQNPSHRTPRHKQSTLVWSKRCVAILDVCQTSFLDLFGTIWCSRIEFFSSMQSEHGLKIWKFQISDFEKSKAFHSLKNWWCSTHTTSVLVICLTICQSTWLWRCYF